MKIIKGWAYSCKECGGHHLLPISISSEKPAAIQIICPHSEENNAKEYQKKCFASHSGIWTSEVIEKQNIKYMI